MRKAYSYIRFSSKKQATGDSLSRQKDIARTYALEHNLELDTTLNFSDLGVSGYTGEHIKSGALGMFIKAVESGLVPKGSILLVEHMDRLSRQSVTEALTVFMDILKSDIDIVTLTDKTVFTKDSINNVYELMGSLMAMSQANSESDRKGKMVRKALDSKRAKNLPVCFGNGPSWLKPKPDNSGWDIVEPLAETVRWVFDTYLSGIGIKTLSKMGNQQGRPFGKINKMAQAQVWRMLRNPAVIGTWELGARVKGKMTLTGEIRKNYYPAVIDEDTYYRAQAKLNGRSFSYGRKDPTYKNLLQGIIRCGHCGAVMTRKRASPAGAPDQATYSCGSRSAGKLKCPTLAAHRLEPVLIPMLYDIAPSELQESEQAALLAKAVSTAKAELDAIDLKLQKLESAIELTLTLNEDITPTMLAIMKKYDVDKSKAIGNLSAIKAKQTAHGDHVLTNVDFDADSILAIIFSESPESTGLRYNEHMKLKATYDYVFVWAEDVVAARYASTKHTAWFPLSRRHISNMPTVPKLDYDNATDAEIIDQINAPHHTLKYIDFVPDWFQNRPALPAGFELNVSTIPSYDESKPMNMDHAVSPTAAALVRYPEPKAVRNGATIRPAVPVRKRKSRAKLKP